MAFPCLPLRAVGVRRAGLALALLLVASSCRTAPIYDVRRAALYPAPLDVRMRQVERAARVQGWETEVLQPGVLLATKRRGRHVASSTIEFDERSFSITLRNSSELKQSGGRIHKAYNEWVRNLADAIRREAASAGYGGPPPPAAGAHDGRSEDPR